MPTFITAVVPVTGLLFHKRGMGPYTTGMRVPPAHTTIIDGLQAKTFPGGKRAVLLVHGFGGTPRDMHYLAGRLHAAGMTVRVMRLPGHATVGGDFNAACRKQWFRAVLDEYLELEAAYESVYVAGLSMGGVLTLLLASALPVGRIALAAPAILLKPKAVALAPLLRLFATQSRRREPREELPDGIARTVYDEYWARLWYHPLGELHKLRRFTLRRLKHVTCPVLTIVSRVDNTVPLSAAALITERVSSQEKRIVTLENSAHVVVNDVEKEEVADQIVDWFSN